MADDDIGEPLYIVADPLVDGATREKASPPSDSSWRATLTDPAVVAVIAYAGVAVLAALAAFLTLFTQFAPYDDEGTLLVTLKAFVHGDTLYRDVYSVYGPFYYEFFGGLFALTGYEITTDVSRSIVLVVWVSTSLFFGIAAQRLTGRLVLGIISMIAAFSALAVLAGEPMHPQGLCVLLLGAFVLVIAGEPTRRPVLAGAACGVLLGALALTKVNLGVFAVAAMILAAVWCVGPLHARRWLRWPVVAVFLAMPLVITARDLSIAWTRELMALEFLAILALLIAAWPLRPQREADDSAPLVRWLVAAFGGFAVALVAILAAILATGVSSADVYDGTITEALRVRDVLVSQFPFPPAALDWGVAAVAVAFLTVRLRPGGIEKPTVWPGLLRVIAGLAILFSVARISPLSLNPSTGNPDTLPMLLAWVAAVPPVGAAESTYRRYLRVLLPALAIAETLQVYPVAGSQMGIASLTFVPVGAICLGDAWSSLRAWSAARGPQSLERFCAVASVAAIAVAGVFVLDTLLRPAATNAVAYREREALPFAGATALRLPVSDTETYRRLVNLLHGHRCTAFAGYPNINSLYLWSGIESPVPQAPGAWINALDGNDQQRVVDSLRASPRPCAIRSKERAELWLRGTPPPDRPLVDYLLNDFKSVARVGEFEFALPNVGTFEDASSMSSPGPGRGSTP